MQNGFGTVPSAAIMNTLFLLGQIAKLKFGKLNKAPLSESILVKD